ncbi:hypothetical protein LR066_00735 [candidate division WOR-3 bacterium]|nr:hypothetical protein [candidate division WOR-3 bacterium]
MRSGKALVIGLIVAAMFYGCAKEDPVGNGDEPVGVIVLTGTYTDTLRLTKENEYLLRGGVFIGNDVDETVLIIEAGTKIYGESATEGMLVITRGSKIIAEGTSTEPIVMTSDKEVGARGRGDWGGLIINGRAPLNVEGGVAFGEGGTGWYGGTDPNDNSGILRYVRVEFAGREISPENELNGIAFQGVGAGTVVDHIQVHMNKDDGVEFFGGTVNVKRVLLTGIADDDFDWTEGWTGKAQFIVAQQYEDDSDNSFEADNNALDHTAVPYSNPIISNFTLIGVKDSPKSDIGMLLRRGTRGKLYNGIIMGFGETGLDIDNEATFNNAGDGSLIVDYCIFYDNLTSFSDDEDGFDETHFATVTMQNNLEAGSSPVVNPYNTGSPNFISQGDALTHPVHIPADPFFESVNFIGGVGPGDDWTSGWTTSARN